MREAVYCRSWAKAARKHYSLDQRSIFDSLSIALNVALHSADKKLRTPIMSPVNPPTFALLALAPPLLLVDTAVTAALVERTPRPPSPVILASHPLFGSVTVAGALVIVAVIAVPLELMVMIVWLALSVWMAMSVVSVPVPTMMERPGVSDSVAEPRVMALPTFKLSCGVAVFVAPGVMGPDRSPSLCIDPLCPSLAVLIGGPACDS